MNNDGSDFPSSPYQETSDTPLETAGSLPPSGPCLPGFEEIAAPPVADALSRQAFGSAPLPLKNARASRAGLRLSPWQWYALSASTVLFIGLVLVVVHKLVKPRTVVREVVREVRVEQGIPLSLLPDTADASVWNVVANMSGVIGGTTLKFTRGIARVNGTEYKVCLDFCRIGNDIYARIVGRASWVVKVTPEGRIVKVYPAPKGTKPLKALFAR